MAEEIKKPRSFDEIIDELFFGKKAALEAMARARHTQYEMRLWRQGLRPDRRAIRHFEKSFLKNVKLKEATEVQLVDAFRSLRFAVGKEVDKPSGCYKRCLRLVNEMNEAIIAEELGAPVAVDRFINFFTFCHGEPVFEKPEFIKTYPWFYDEDNRKEFRATIKYLRAINCRAAPKQLFKILRSVKYHSVKN